MKQIEVTIMGQSYLLGCPEGGETSLLEAVGNVDREMCAIRDAGKVKARERIAVLTALNLAYQRAEAAHAPAPAAAPAPTLLTKEDFKNDPLIQKALEVFKGEIVGIQGN